MGQPRLSPDPALPRSPVSTPFPPEPDKQLSPNGTPSPRAERDQVQGRRDRLLAGGVEGVVGMAQLVLDPGSGRRPTRLPRVTAVVDLRRLPAPIVQAGMGAVARHELAAAVSEAGGLGTIGGARGRIAEELAAARRLTGRPIAVNLVLPLLRPGDVQAAADADVIVTFWGRATPACRRHLGPSVRLGRGGKSRRGGGCRCGDSPRSRGRRARPRHDAAARIDRARSGRGQGPGPRGRRDR